MPKLNLDSTLKAAFITGIFAVVAVLAGSLFEANIEPRMPPALPTGLPTFTPVPTVVGTPILGTHLGTSGPIGFTVLANGVSLSIDEVLAYKHNLSGWPPHEGYAYVVVKARIVNNSSYWIVYEELQLVDNSDNRYLPRLSMFEQFGLPGFPYSLAPLESASGALVYEIPLAALNNLRFRLDPRDSILEEPRILLEVQVGELIVQ